MYTGEVAVIARLVNDDVSYYKNGKMKYQTVGYLLQAKDVFSYRKITESCVVKKETFVTPEQLFIMNVKEADEYLHIDDKEGYPVICASNVAFDMYGSEKLNRGCLMYVVSDWLKKKDAYACMRNIPIGGVVSVENVLLGEKREVLGYGISNLGVGIGAYVLNGDVNFIMAGESAVVSYDDMVTLLSLVEAGLIEQPVKNIQLFYNNGLDVCCEMPKVCVTDKDGYLKSEYSSTCIAEKYSGRIRRKPAVNAGIASAKEYIERLKNGR